MELGGTEILILIAVLLLLFGPSKVADLGGSLGKAIHDFKKGLKDPVEEKPAPAPAAPQPQLAEASVAAPAAPVSPSEAVVDALSAPSQAK